MQTDHEREHHEPESADKSAPFPIPSQIPVFALPNVVMFPKTYLPLHIFEPRYRQMVDDTVMGVSLPSRRRLTRLVMTPDRKSVV